MNRNLIYITTISAAAGAAILWALSQQKSSPQLDADFLAFSDTHCGEAYASQPDHLDSNTRFQNLLNIVNMLKVRFISDNGDLINGWCMKNGEIYPGATCPNGVCTCSGTDASYMQSDTNMYNSYLGIRTKSANSFLQVRGNHDANPSLYTGMIDTINWSKRFDDVLAVGIGSVELSAADWEENIITYDSTTTDFLNNVIASSDYAQTKYHFLFHHFVPYLDSTPAINTVTAGVDAVYNKFDMAFCGHLGGRPIVWTNKAAPCIKSDHLADGLANASGLTNMGFNSVHINRSTDEIIVIHHGLDGSSSVLLNYNRIAGIVYVAPEALATRSIHYEVDMTAAV